MTVPVCEGVVFVGNSGSLTAPGVCLALPNHPAISLTYTQGNAPHGNNMLHVSEGGEAAARSTSKQLCCCARSLSARQQPQSSFCLPFACLPLTLHPLPLCCPSSPAPSPYPLLLHPLLAPTPLTPLSHPPHSRSPPPLPGWPLECTQLRVSAPPLTSACNHPHHVHDS